MICRNDFNLEKAVENTSFQLTNLNISWQKQNSSYSCLDLWLGVSTVSSHDLTFLWQPCLLFYSNLMSSLSLDVCFRFNLIFLMILFEISDVSLIFASFLFFFLNQFRRCQATPACFGLFGRSKVNKSKCITVSNSLSTTGWSSTSPWRKYYHFDPPDSLLVLTLKL